MHIQKNNEGKKDKNERMKKINEEENVLSAERQSLRHVLDPKDDRTILTLLFSFSNLANMVVGYVALCSFYIFNLCFKIRMEFFRSG